MEIITHPFQPIIDCNSEILILGSFPSVISRENDFYYGNKKNRFWTLLSKIFDRDFTVLTNIEKRNTLLKLHIALYDSVYSCAIYKSSDETIEDVCYSDIPSLIKESKIKHIYCNGNKAYELLMNAYPSLKAMTILLPSTSPRNASYSLDRLYEKWQMIKD